MFEDLIKDNRIKVYRPAGKICLWGGAKHNCGGYVAQGIPGLIHLDCYYYNEDGGICSNGYIKEWNPLDTCTK